MTDGRSTPLSHTARFECDALAIRGARALVGEMLTREGWAPLDVERARLVVSELVANAVVHARSPFTLSYSYDGVLRVGVTDDDPHSDPHPKDAEPGRIGGMGLRLVAEISRDWGVDRTATGKTVWSVLEPQHDRQMASSSGA
jgi:anti-sigma regulatory factor (Ser/Thr protein kinase)